MPDFLKTPKARLCVLAVAVLFLPLIVVCVLLCEMGKAVFGWLRELFDFLVCDMWTCSPPEALYLLLTSPLVLLGQLGEACCDWRVEFHDCLFTDVPDAWRYAWREAFPG